MSHNDWMCVIWLGAWETMAMLLSLLLTLQVSMGHTWEQKVIRLYLLIMLSSVTLRQRSWNDYYNGWYQSRFAPINAALKADPRCPPGSDSTFDEPR